MIPELGHLALIIALCLALVLTTLLVTGCAGREDDLNRYIDEVKARPATPIPPGESVVVGFSHDGRFPDGITKNGGGAGQFILPSGVVLTSFGSSFVPAPYFESGRGVDSDNGLSPRDFENGFWHGKTKPAFGAGSRYTVRNALSMMA